MDRMTDEQAEALLKRMDKLTAALGGVRLWKIVTAVTAALAVVLLFVIVEQREDGKDLAEQTDRIDRAVADIQSSRIQQCQNGNVTRAGQRKIWEFYFEVTHASAAAQGVPRVVLNFYEDYLAWITDEVLPDRDCTDLGKEYPEPGPPPSYEKALEKALAEQGD